MPELPVPTTIERLSPSRCPEAARMLARAFDVDPLMRHYLPVSAERARLLPGLMAASLRYCLDAGEVHTTPDLAGAACWLPPGRAALNPWGLLRSGLGVVPLRFAFLAFRRLLQVEPWVARIHEQSISTPHWYLMVLGVEPAHQGRGLGAALIAPALRRADQQRMPCYLETMLPRNVTFYRRAGFSVAREERLPGADLPFWAMLRPPAGEEMR